mgnify:FL=1
MSIAQKEEKKAVEAGYWQNFRYDPRLKEEGKNPFHLTARRRPPAIVTSSWARFVTTP